MEKEEKQIREYLLELGFVPKDTTITGDDIYEHKDEDKKKVIINFVYVPF